MSEEEKSLIKRLSDAYPPTSLHNSSYVAECHYLLSCIDVKKIKPEDIVYRPVKYKSDMT